MSDIKYPSQRDRIPVSINAEERAMLDAIAAAWGVSRAAAIRRLIRESPVGKGTVALAGSTDADSSHG